MSIIKVDELSPRSGSDIAITSLKTITGLASQFKITGGTAGHALITDGSGGLSFGTVDSLPTQTSQSGKFLTTDGSTASWATVDALPNQTSQAGEFLKTDGTTATWEPVEEFSVSIAEAAPGSASAGALWWKSNEGRLKIYYNDGSSSQWVDAFPVAESPPADPAVGGDLTGTASNAQIVANAVGAAEIATNAVSITELNVTDGTAGQALMTDGSGTMTFGDVDSLPAQTSNAGKFLTTDGTDPSWGAVSVSAAAVSNQANTSTSYFDIPAGTTAQRPGSPAMGNMRYNSTVGEMEHWSGTGWIGFAGTVPIITSIGPTTAAETGTTITISGANFSGSSTVQLIGTDNSVTVPQSVTFVNVSTLSITTPALTVALEPYDVRVTNPDGQYYTLVNALDAGGVPAWTTPAGSIGSIFDVVNTPGVTHFTLVAGDPDSTAVTFTETTSVLTTAGLTLNSTTGAITGDTPTTQAPNAATTYNFDVDASDGVNNTSRSFSVTVSDLPSGGNTATYIDSGQGYKSHEFVSTGAFYTASDLICDIMLVAGGGAGGNCHTTNGNGGGGAGGMVVASDYTLSSGSHTITIGAGGAYSGGSSNQNGATGNDSVVTNTSGALTGVGGGGGSGQLVGPGQGLPGGSGGGGSRAGTGPSNGQGGVSTQDSAGTQNNPAQSIAAYGNVGGYTASSDWNGAGGGGAGTPGMGYGGPGPYDNASPGTHPGGDGGRGIQCAFKDGGFAVTGNDTIWYAGGGGGGGNSSEKSGDGWHGGGRGYGTTNQYNNTQFPPLNATTLGSGTINAIINKGGGGGAGSYWANNTNGSGDAYGGGAGGSGVVIIRYKSG